MITKIFFEMKSAIFNGFIHSPSIHNADVFAETRSSV